MAVKERDPLTGHQTTGHEWNGITELNTRVPRFIWWFIAVTHIYAVVVWVLMPAWPGINGYTQGLLGTDQYERLAAELQDADAARGDWSTAVANTPIEEIRANPALMEMVNATAPALFGDNCAGCHGSAAEGGPGYPSLVDEAWLWGGDPQTILETLRVGINAERSETRFAQMPALGANGTLSRDEVRVVADYVQSLSGAEIDANRRAQGAELFAQNCTSCHGPDGTGMNAVGAPNLTDDAWIYGADDATLFRTIHGGRQGWMPAWEDRLSDVERRILTIHLLELGEEGR